MVKREFAELDALSDGSTDAIYLEDQIISRFGRVMDHLVGMVAMSKFSNSGIREVTEAWGVRSDLTSAKSSPPTFEWPEVGFLGTVTSGKLPKVKEKPTVASI